MEEFTQLFGNLLAFVYHCFDRMVIHGYLSGLARPEQVVYFFRLIEQTKSRPRHSNDNGLVETKNGAVIRKHLGYGYIAAQHAEPIQHFYSAHFNPYLNYHRPCAQADVEVDAKGRERRLYRRYQTPLETLLALPNPTQYLRPGMTVAVLQRVAATLSDTQAAQRMQKAKGKLFEQLRPAGLGRP
jgi:hypothetical protein